MGYFYVSILEIMCFPIVVSIDKLCFPPSILSASRFHVFSGCIRLMQLCVENMPRPIFCRKYILPRTFFYSPTNLHKACLRFSQKRGRKKTTISDFLKYQNPGSWARNWRFTRMSHRTLYGVNSEKTPILVMTFSLEKDRGLRKTVGKESSLWLTYIFWLKEVSSNCASMKSQLATYDKAMFRISRALHRQQVLVYQYWLQSA